MGFLALGSLVGLAGVVERCKELNQWPYTYAILAACFLVVAAVGFTSLWQEFFGGKKRRGEDV